MEKKINSFSCRRVIEVVLRSQRRACDVVAKRHGRRTVGAYRLSRRRVDFAQGSATCPWGEKSITR